MCKCDFFLEGLGSLLNGIDCYKGDECINECFGNDFLEVIFC